MKIAVAREIDPAEPRVAASPDTVKKFKALGVDVAIELIDLLREDLDLAIPSLLERARRQHGVLATLLGVLGHHVLQPWGGQNGVLAFAIRSISLSAPGVEHPRIRVTTSGQRNPEAVNHSSRVHFSGHRQHASESAPRTWTQWKQSVTSAADRSVS